MKLLSFAAIATLSLAAPLALAQDNQESHGSGGTPPPPTYVPPPPVGGYAGPTYAPAPPPPYGPKKMNYEEGDPVPPGYRVEERARVGLVVGGAVLFGIPYLFTVLGASIANDLGDKDAAWLYLPVAGPFVYTTTYSCDENRSGGCSTGKTFLYLDGLAQGGGVIMFILGLSGRKMLIRNDVAEVEVMPTFGKNGNGFALIGRF
jgi:hypothetical protein